MQLLHPCSLHPCSFSTLAAPIHVASLPCSPHPCSFPTLAAPIHAASRPSQHCSTAQHFKTPHFLSPSHPSPVFHSKGSQYLPMAPLPLPLPPTSPQPPFSQRRHKQNPVIATDRGSPEQGARGDRGIARCSIVRECRSRHSLAVFARYCRKAHQIRRIDAAV